MFLKPVLLFVIVCAHFSLPANSSGCVDTSPMCEEWAKREECTKNPRWMKPNCRKSCGLCQPHHSTQSYDENNAPETSTISSGDTNCQSKVPGACNSCVGGIQPYPHNLPNSHFYQRICYTKKGLKVITSDKASNESLHRAAYLIDNVVAKVDPRVIQSMNDKGFRHAVMAAYLQELTTHLPEQSHFNATYWNERARGLGGTVFRPLGSCAEENLMCHSNDRYKGEDITIHEFAHSLHLLGLAPIFPSFNEELETLFKSTRSNPQNPWAGHYAMSNKVEYYAEAVQTYFNANRHGGPTGRAGLEADDKAMYTFLEKYLGEPDWSWSCG